MTQERGCLVLGVSVAPGAFKASGRVSYEAAVWVLDYGVVGEARRRLVRPTSTTAPVCRYRQTASRPRPRMFLPSKSF
jgi:hypothetical protein